MTEYRGYKYQQNDNDKWDVMYPGNDTKPWVVDFESEAIVKAWIDEKIADEEAQISLDNRVTTLEADSMQDETDINALEDAVIELAEDIAEIRGGSV